MIERTPRWPPSPPRPVRRIKISADASLLAAAGDGLRVEASIVGGRLDHWMTEREVGHADAVLRLVRQHPVECGDHVRGEALTEVVEHPHLARMPGAEGLVYVDSLAYDADYYRGVGHALKQRLEQALATA